MITSKVMDITPETAAEMLTHNTDNVRKLSRSEVKRLADEMASGRWELNGETIVFDENGVLKNGQHRLAAIIMSGKTVKMLVVRGVSESVSVYDIQKRRTPTEILKSKGLDCNPSITAAAGIIVNRFSRSRVSNSDLNDYISRNFDELNRAFRVCTYGNNKHSKNAACIAATYLVLRTQTMPVYEVELFFRVFNDIYTNADGYETSPAMIARKMFDDREGKNGYQIQKERIEILVLALTDFHKNVKREMKYRIGEPFKFISLMDKARFEERKEAAV